MQEMTKDEMLYEKLVDEYYDDLRRDYEEE
jgi:hypothetical protein